MPSNSDTAPIPWVLSPSELPVRLLCSWSKQYILLPWIRRLKHFYDHKLLTKFQRLDWSSAKSEGRSSNEPQIPPNYENSDDVVPGRGWCEQEDARDLHNPSTKTAIIDLHAKFRYNRSNGVCWVYGKKWNSQQRETDKLNQVLQYLGKKPSL